MSDSLERTWRLAGPLPLWLWALLVLGAMVAAALSYRREARSFGRGRCAVLASLRCGAIAALAVMLAQPVEESRRLGRPRLALLVDRSESMTTADVPAANAIESSSSDLPTMHSRAEAASRWLTSGEAGPLSTLQQRFDVTLADGARSGATLSADELAAPLGEAAADATRLGDALVSALADDAAVPAAIVLVTDGVSTAGRSLDAAVQQAAALGVPVFPVAVGSERPRPDVTVDALLAERTVFRGDRLELAFRVRATGYSGERAIATLTLDDSPVGEVELTLPADGETTAATIPWNPAAAGAARLAVQIAPREGEFDHENNRSTADVVVREEPIRTLLVAATPGFEFRALKSLLERDPAIELSALLQDADADFVDVDRAAVRRFPVTREEFRAYDVVLLGDVDPELLPQGCWDALDQYVSEEGAGAAVIAGPRFMPASFRDVPSMQTLLPLAEFPLNPLRMVAQTEAAFRVTPTDRGAEQGTFQLGASRAESAEIWRALPPVTWQLAPVEPKPGAETLAVFTPATAPSAPFTQAEPAAPPAILRHYVGAGEVVMHLFDESWRWRWRNDDRYFARYWGQLVRRLARGRIARGDVRLATDRPRYELGEAVQVRVDGLPATGSTAGELGVELVGATTPTRRLALQQAPGRRDQFIATIDSLPADDYRVAVVGDSELGLATAARFVVTAPPGELARIAVDKAALENAAAATGGRFFTLAEADELLAALPAPQPTVLERLPPRPLWDGPWVIGLACALFGAEWLLRRQNGMM